MVLYEWEKVRPVLETLEQAGITAALGGSAVLCALGLQDRPPTDWDLTTDADPEAVKAALADLPVAANPKTGDGIFATGARFSFGKVDLMVRFAIRGEAGIVHLPTVVERRWGGLPVGSPAVWAVAYQLMGRLPKADLLSGWLRAHGVAADLKARLLAEPLPEALRQEVAGWPER
jgi:hypothetical protein